MAARKPVVEVPAKTPAKGPNAQFAKAAGGSTVSVRPGLGGVSTGMPTSCNSKRAADNVKTGYSGGY